MKDHSGYKEEDILRAVCASLDEAILVIDPDTRSVVHCNPVVSQVFGYDPKELQGRSTRILHVDDAGYAEFGRLSERALDKGGSFYAEQRMRRKNGSTFPAEITTTPIVPEESWLAGVISVVRDVTRKKRDDEARRRNQQRLRMILDRVPAIVWTTDLEFRITSVLGHQRSLLTDEPDSLVGKSLHEFLGTNENYGETKEAHEQALHGGHGEYEITYAGTVFVGRTEPLFEEGEIAGVVGLGYDISAQRQYENELKASIREKEILIQEIRHRVKNNLQLIQSILSIHSSQATSSEVREELTLAGQRVYSLSTAYNLLINKGSIDYIEMKEYLRSIADSFLQTSDNKVEVITEVEEMELHLDTAVPCGMVVNELASQSVYHLLAMGQSGVVRLAMRTDGEDIVVSVATNGAIPPDEPSGSSYQADWMIVDALVSQLDGSMSTTFEDGMKVEIRFTPRAPYGG